ncbi:hypothetical protein U1Q18_013899 [Sarracenia purpurea var. burkii]
MWQRKLQSPFCTIIRRTLSPASRLSADATPQTPLPAQAPFFSLGSLCSEDEYRAFRLRRFGNPEFPAKNFSSECAKSVVQRCWNCTSVAQAVPFLVCDNCRTVQPVDPSVDYFQIFGL